MIFHLGDILSITTGALVSPDRMAGVHGLLDFMTGDSLFTHQLPRACDECRPALLAQHPDLADIEVPAQFMGEEHVWLWLSQQTDRYGETRDVQPLAPEDHTHISPFVELQMVAPDLPVLAIEVG